MSYNNEQKKFLSFLFKKSKPKMIASTKKTPPDSCASAFILLNETVLGITSDITKKGEKKPCCGGSEGSEFFEVMQEMQGSKQLETLLKDAEATAQKISADPKEETKKFIDEMFVILDKCIDGTLDAEEAAVETVVPEVAEDPEPED